MAASMPDVKLRVSYDKADTFAQQIDWLVDSDPLELRDLALNLLHDVEVLKAELERLARVEAKAIRVVQLAERDNTAGTYKAIAELRRVLDERGGGQ